MAIEELEATALDTHVQGQEALVRVAVGQTVPRVGHKEENVRDAVDVLRRAVDQEVDLIILPELGNTGYMFNSRAEAFAHAEPIPDGLTCQAYLAEIQGSKTYVVAGICERAGDRLYNSAAVLGPDGYIGTFRKLHLWHRERLFFEPGDLGLPIFHLPFGRIGVMICYDGWFPEVARILKLRGADIICDPTCWDVVPGHVDVENNPCPTIHMAQAHMNNLFIACADRCGVERGCTFSGMSCIAGPNGYVAGPASVEDPELLIADINLAEARYQHWTELSDPIADRRTDVYAADLGYGPAFR